MLYIRGRVSPCYRSRKRNKKGRGKRRAFFAVFTVIFLLFIWVSEWGLSSVSEELTQEAAKSYVVSCMNKAAEKALSKDETCFVRVSYGSDGRVTAVSADTAALNRLKTEMLNELEKELNGRMSLSVPVGSLTDVAVLNGRGFSVPIKLQFEGSADVSFETGFQSAGINQSCHRITMTVKAQVYSQSKKFEVYTEESTMAVLAETVIVGTVPNITTRLFDDQPE